MENPTRYTNYKDFFPFYLREHSKKSTRIFHYFGTIGYQILFWSLIFTQNYIFIPLVLLAGYGPAWIGHFFIEKNKPDRIYDYVTIFCLFLLIFRGGFVSFGDLGVSFSDATYRGPLLRKG